MENLKAVLQQAADDYYNGNPTMSDAAFDKLAEASGYEEVGTSSSGNRVSHMYQMYSLQKVFSNEASTKDPFNNYKGAVVVSPKLDGAAVSLLYVNGEFNRALTRGDGKKGLNITSHISTLVPKYLDFGSGIQNIIQVTGEVVAPKTLKNARNYAAGALNLKDTTEFQTRDLHFIAYGLQESWNELWTEDLVFLSESGFDTVTQSNWTQYPDDGLVFRIDSHSEFNERGHTSHHPRGAYALKQIQKGVETTLNDVVWNVGKSGVVSPVAVLEPIEIDGAMISKATLHNMRYIVDLDLEIGCRVEVIRSGEIIPRIVRRV
jgi:DNA ligase (NAD+)